MEDLEKWVNKALECGADKAVVISSEQMVLSAAYRTICEGNGCGAYDRCWTCPPNRGTAEECMAKVRSFRHGILYQTITAIEDSFDFEGMAVGRQRHEAVSQKIREEITAVIEGESLQLSCGGCKLCERCAKLDDQPCRFPDKALGSMEGYCFDVYKTTKDTPLKYINGPDTVTYFGIVLL